MSQRTFPDDRHQRRRAKPDNGYMDDLLVPPPPVRQIPACDVCRNEASKTVQLIKLTQADRDAYPTLAHWITTTCTRCSVGRKIEQHRRRNGGT